MSTLFLIGLTALIQTSVICEYTDELCRLSELEKASGTHMTRKDYLASRTVIYEDEAVRTKSDYDAQLVERILVAAGIVSALIGKDGVRWLIRAALKRTEENLNGNTS